MIKIEIKIILLLIVSFLMFFYIIKILTRYINPECKNVDNILILSTISVFLYVFIKILLL